MEVIDMGTAKIKEQPLRAILYGEAGSGKTHLMREFPKPMLVYDFDGKYEPLIGIEGITVKSFRISEKSESKKNWLDFWAEWRKDKKDETWETIVLDSLTSLDSIMFCAMIQMAGYNPDDKNTYQAYTRPLYGDLKSTYITLFNSMRSCNKNVIILAHELFQEDDNGKLLGVKPLVTGGIKDSLSAIFKDTWYLEYVKQGKIESRILHYQKYKMRTCSSTMMDKDGSIKDPTYEKIVAEYRN